jgi:hypothetical protein
MDGDGYRGKDTCPQSVLLNISESSLNLLNSLCLLQMTRLEQIYHSNHLLATVPNKYSRDFKALLLIWTTRISKKCCILEPILLDIAEYPCPCHWGLPPRTGRHMTL